MKIDKITIGLSIVLAAVVALAVFSASFPASGTDAVQNATVTRNITAIKIAPANGTYEATTEITYWNFTGTSGATVDDPTNSQGDTQVTGTNQSAVACLNNTNAAAAMTVSITNDTFSGTNIVSKEEYNITDGMYVGYHDPAIWFEATDWTELTAANAPAATLGANVNWSVWVRIDVKKAGTATSTFNVTAEV